MNQRHVRISIWILAALLLVAAPATLAAQQPSAQAAARTLSGRVLKDGRPVAGAAVTVHEVTQAKSGPIAQLRSDASGRFRAVLPPPVDGGFAVYFATVDYESVRYFGPPLHASDTVADYTVAVSDTASVLPGAIRTSRRDLVLVPGTDGSWQVNEGVLIRNDATRTLVSRHGKPTWAMRLPTGADSLQAGQGDLGAEHVRFQGSWVFFDAALVPGDRELFVRYRLPAGTRTSSITFAEPTDTLAVSVLQPAPPIEIHGLSSTHVVTADGQRFVQYMGTGFKKGDKVSMGWKSTSPPVSPVLAGVVAAVLLLVIGGWAAIRNRGVPQARASLEPGAGGAV
ncbi:MAG TPA: carboxypeptidase-like regulatory domain-containing protein [Longimicrobiaceae bacterium]|nr:carboxypeptidase-like regulatory domain-containing protein [Longimicrobiaceae bacterium]